MPVTPNSMNRVMAKMTEGATCGAMAATLAKSKEKTPPSARGAKYLNIKKAAIKKPKSPMRLTMKAFLPAMALPMPSLPLSYQKPISKYEHRPTPSQPTKSIR